MTHPPIDPAEDQPIPSSAGQSAWPPRARRTYEHHAPAASGRRAAAKFVGRIARLQLDEVTAAVDAWRDTMRTEAVAFFEAEEAVSRALITSGRHDEQKPLLVHIADAFRERVWYGSRAPGAAGHPPAEAEQRVRATEASGQYLGTLAMLALLVRDHLPPAQFDLLYEPFARLIPLEELAPE